ncbi:hypothetical protein KDW_32660 [Dictyobacter vulcani]|uniref:Uncharacterized protein n=1 Tax=Dictyobacter vulcani TaxID=2607529 RepID=A0A5J4KI16_9CHLR|nr:hypothetical protein [Dictyobacter vulcani]GER89104.1 hypothetical protein KDW_32660 [Dictyobacter vulcani]
MLKESTEAQITLMPLPFAVHKRGSWLKKQSGTLAGIAKQLHISLYSTQSHTCEPAIRRYSRPTLGLKHMPFETQGWLNNVIDSTHYHSGDALLPVKE